MNNLKLWGLTDIHENMCEEVNFHGCSLTDSDLDSIAEALVENTVLRRLILNSNSQLTGTGVAKMLRKLPPKSPLEEIFLWGCDLNDSDVKCIAQALATNDTVTGLWFDDRPKLRGTGKEAEVGAELEKAAAGYEEEQSWEQAQQQYEKALQTKIEELGPDHEYVGDTHFSLANILEKLNLLEEALVNYKAAHLIFTKHLDHEHIKIATSLDRIANIVSIQNTCQCIQENRERIGCLLDPALQRLKRSLEIKLSILPADDVRIAESHDWIGAVLQKQGRLDDALRKYDQALAVHQSRNTTTVGTAHVYFHKGTIYTAQNDWSAAKECFQSSSQTFISHLGSGHSKVAECYHELAKASQQLGEFDEAI